MTYALLSHKPCITAYNLLADTKGVLGGSQNSYKNKKFINSNDLSNKYISNQLFKDR